MISKAPHLGPTKLLNFVGGPLGRFFQITDNKEQITIIANGDLIRYNDCALGDVRCGV